LGLKKRLQGLCCSIRSLIQNQKFTPDHVTTRTKKKQNDTEQQPKEKKKKNKNICQTVSKK